MTTYLDRLISQLPTGTDRAILRIISFHQGKSNAISRKEFLHQLNRLGFDLGDRPFRAAVSQLKTNGELICSTGGEQGGYWWAISWPELAEYHETEPIPRAMQMLEQVKAQKATASQLWGPESLQFTLDI